MDLMFNKDFREYLRKNNFPEVYFHNSYALANALESEEYKYLVENYKPGRYSFGDLAALASETGIGPPS